MKKEFKEKKIVNFVYSIGFIVFLLSIVMAFIFVFIKSDYSVVLFLMGLILSAVFMSIGNGLSKRKTYTRKFLKNIENEYEKSNTIKSCKSLLNYFESQAIKNEHYCLDYVIDLKVIHNRIKDKIHTLECIS